MILACPWAAVKLLGAWTTTTAASAYAYGGGAHARAWFANTLVRRVVVDFANLQGYIEVSRLVAGEWWSPSQNADWNTGLTAGSTGAAFRDGAGGHRFPPTGLPIAVLVLRVLGYEIPVAPADLGQMMPPLLGMLGIGSLRKIEK